MKEATKGGVKAEGRCGCRKEDTGGGSGGRGKRSAHRFIRNPHKPISDLIKAHRTSGLAINLLPQLLQRFPRPLSIERLVFCRAEDRWEMGGEETTEDEVCVGYGGVVRGVTVADWTGVGRGGFGTGGELGRRGESVGRLLPRVVTLLMEIWVCTGASRIAKEASAPFRSGRTTSTLPQPQPC
jgi:hypothetical protein